MLARRALQHSRLEAEKAEGTAKLAAVGSPALAASGSGDAQQQAR